MARENLGVIGQTEQALDDVGTKLLIVAAREVGAADTAAEERIAREDPTFDFSIETDATDGMTWGADDLQGAFPHFDDLSVFQVEVRQAAVAWKRHSEHRCLLPRAEKVVFHVGMCRHLDAISLLHSGITNNMVNMAMRVDDHQWFEAVAVNEAEEFVFLRYIGTTWIDDDTFFSVFVANNIGVFREGIEYEGFKLEHQEISVLKIKIL